MNPQLRNVHVNIRALGLNALEVANWHEHYHHQVDTNNLEVLHAAHAAELLIKARIAEEHPLLIFDQLPKVSRSAKGLLDFDDLFEKGRTLDYADLPARLWAATGISVPALDRYTQFGKLRNAVQHFAAPQRPLGLDVSHFIYEVIDPFINQCWDLFAVDFNEDRETDYLMSTLVQRKVSFLVSPDAALVWNRCCEHLESYGKKDASTAYFKEMDRRAKTMLAKVKRQRAAERRRLRARANKATGAAVRTGAPAKNRVDRAATQAAATSSAKK